MNNTTIIESLKLALLAWEISDQFDCVPSMNRLDDVMEDEELDKEQVIKAITTYDGNSPYDMANAVKRLLRTLT